MPDQGLLDKLPLGGLLVATVAIVLASLEGGYRLGIYRHKRSESEKELPVGEMVAATLGLLAFLLAFTFSFAASRYENRKQLVLDEANAVGTAWLRAGLLTEPESAESRSLLREYVAVRVEGVSTGDLATASAGRKNCTFGSGRMRKTRLGSRIASYGRDSTLRR